MKVFLEYKFIFEPDERIRNLETFERTVAEVFRQMGYQAENVKTVDEELCKIVFLQPLDIEPEVKAVELKTPSKILNEMGKKKDSTGKFRKQNG